MADPSTTSQRPPVSPRTRRVPQERCVWAKPWTSLSRVFVPARGVETHREGCREHCSTIRKARQWARVVDAGTVQRKRPEKQPAQRAPQTWGRRPTPSPLASLLWASDPAGAARALSPAGRLHSESHNRQRRQGHPGCYGKAPLHPSGTAGPGTHRRLCRADGEARECGSVGPGLPGAFPPRRAALTVNASITSR